MHPGGAGQLDGSAEGVRIQPATPPGWNHDGSAKSSRVRFEELDARLWDTALQGMGQWGDVNCFAGQSGERVLDNVNIIS